MWMAIELYNRNTNRFCLFGIVSRKELAIKFGKRAKLTNFVFSSPKNVTKQWRLWNNLIMWLLFNVILFHGIESSKMSLSSLSSVVIWYIELPCSGNSIKFWLIPRYPLYYASWFNIGHVWNDFSSLPHCWCWIFMIMF